MLVVRLPLKSLTALTTLYSCEVFSVETGKWILLLSISSARTYTSVMLLHYVSKRKKKAYTSNCTWLSLCHKESAQRQCWSSNSYRFVLFCNVAKTVKASSAAVRCAAMQQMSLTEYCLQGSVLHCAALGPYLGAGSTMAILTVSACWKSLLHYSEYLCGDSLGNGSDA